MGRLILVTLICPNRCILLLYIFIFFRPFSFYLRLEFTGNNLLVVGLILQLSHPVIYVAIPHNFQHITCHSFDELFHTTNKILLQKFQLIIKVILLIIVIANKFGRLSQLEIGHNRQKISLERHFLILIDFFNSSQESRLSQILDEAHFCQVGIHYDFFES